MKKWSILILMICFLPTVMAYTEVDYSLDNLTWYEAGRTSNNYFVVEQMGNIGGGLDDGTTYYFRARHIYADGISNYTYFTTATEQGGEPYPMAELAITFFMMAITGVLFYIPFKIKFSPNKYVNLIIKRGCFVVGFFLMALNSAIMSTIADTAGLELTREMFTMMVIFGWGGWIAAIFMIFKTLIDTIQLYKIRKDNDRFGRTDNETFYEGDI